MKLWKIDDGAIHAVAALNEAQALGLYVENVVERGGDWPEEKPVVEEYEGHVPYTLNLDGGARKITLYAREWTELLQAPQYVGCSEF